MWVDSNNDGVKDGHEQVLEGVTISLTGTGVEGAVNLTTTTGVDGSYNFGTDEAPLTPGAYTVMQHPVAMMLDGIDTPGNNSSLTANNDEFSITIDGFGRDHQREQQLWRAGVGAWLLLDRRTSGSSS